MKDTSKFNNFVVNIDVVLSAEIRININPLIFRKLYLLKNSLTSTPVDTYFFFIRGTKYRIAPLTTFIQTSNSTSLTSMTTST